MRKKLTLFLIALIAIGGIAAALYFGDFGSFSRQEAAVTVSEKELRDGTVEEALEEGKARYINDTYGFSFAYPEDYTLSAIPDADDTFVILVQNPNGREGFQVYAAPYDEPWPITPERIHRDLPGLRIEDSQYVVIGDGALDALIFFGESEEFGETREVWFIHEEVLYQVTTHADLDQFIGPVMESWRFK